MKNRILILSIFFTFISSFCSIISGEYISAQDMNGNTVRGYFGSSIANIGNLDGYGIEDLVVGVPLSDTNVMNSGSVEILFLNKTEYYTTVTLDNNSPLLTDSLATEDLFGSSVSFLGDFYGNGNKVIAVGAPGTDYDGYSSIGCVWLLELNHSGTILSSKRIKYPDSGNNFFLFGSSSAPLKGINGLNNRVIAIAAPGFYSSKGCIFIVKVNVDNTITLLNDIVGRDIGSSVVDGDCFGASMANAGDLDNNGVDDLIVGAPLNDSDGKSGNGAFYIIYLNNDGSVNDYKKFFPQDVGIDSEDYSQCGYAVTTLNDIDRDGNNEILISSYQRDQTSINRGSIDIVSLDHNENFLWSKNLNDGSLDAQLYDNDMFGSSVTGYQDMNENGIPTVIACASNSNGGIGSFFKINVTGPVATDSAYVENATDVDLNCTANTKGIDTELYYEYGLSESFGDTLFYGIDINSSTAEAFFKNISILDTNTTYYYRAITSNINGIS
ncbi:MAG: hypothetical protein GQ534_07235, partial [Candidatus Delongbacteria bacterium]|nr:hypothetical protein [Candidatus Delongbacteria bacterium]